MYYRVVFNSKTAKWNLQLGTNIFLGLIVNWTQVLHTEEGDANQTKKSKIKEFGNLQEAEDFIEDIGLHLVYYPYRQKGDPLNCCDTVPSQEQPVAESSASFRRTARRNSFDELDRIRAASAIQYVSA